MGFSRDTFYRYQEAVETGRVELLVNKSKRGPNVKNRIDPTIEDAVVALAVDQLPWAKQEPQMNFSDRAYQSLQRVFEAYGFVTIFRT